MITLICGTNNSDSFTKIVSDIYLKEIKKLTDDVLFFSLEEMDGLTLNASMYRQQQDLIVQIQKKYFDPADKFVFVIPEYNGSYPGVLKLLIDILDWKPAFLGKKAAIVGVSTGRAGNLRGIDQLTAVLQHLQVTVMPKILPVSSVKNELDDTNQLKNIPIKDAMLRHVESFLKF